MDPEGTGEGPPRSVLARGLSLLDAFGSADTELNLTELAARTGLPKPTAHRLLSELVRWGGVERTETGYRLSMRLFVLGQRAPRPRGLREAALPYLEDLYEATHENIHLAVLDGMDTLFLEKVSGRRSMPIVSRVGGRLPAYCTATGKLFLAFGPPERLQRVLDAGLVRYTPHTIIMPGLLQRELARTADRGYAVNREESEAGVSAVAAPVLDHRRRVIAAISITGNVCRLDLDRLAPAVRTAALALSRELARESAAGELKTGIPR
ncbi:IclR family transcriptional regulator [Actinomadura sp. 3N508]|uniref:IclR family transcriptional regulator n=1 Tax=Actinomadura sp. 3N508 TaxID=3375153 RepID=UPI0037B53D4F